jgi:ribosomal protein L37AE/L43A
MTDEQPLWPLADDDQLAEPADSTATVPAYPAANAADATSEPSTAFFDAPGTFAPAYGAAGPAPASSDEAAGRDRVTCPECGAVQDIHLNRRESVDFCRNCDFPLFWTPSEVIRDRGAGEGEGLRRLPGTVGRSTLASMACPHCAELNLVTAEVCIRCGRPMHPVVDLPPPPAPVYIPPPPPVVAPPPPRDVPWWVWAAAIVGGLAVLVFAILLVTDTIG